MAGTDILAKQQQGPDIHSHRYTEILYVVGHSVLLGWVNVGCGQCKRDSFNCDRRLRWPNQRTETTTPSRAADTIAGR